MTKQAPELVEGWRAYAAWYAGLLLGAWAVAALRDVGLWWGGPAAVTATVVTLAAGRWWDATHRGARP